MNGFQIFKRPSDGWLTTQLASSFQRYANNTALSVGEECWTYQELWRRATALSVKLATETGAVALIGTRSIEDYAAVLGIFLSGRTYAPINPNAAVPRLTSHLQLAKATTLMCARETPLFRTLGSNGTWKQRPIDLGTTASALPPPQPEKLAYIMATSGSSGPPKAVPISRKNLKAYLKNALGSLDIRSNDRTSQIFDLSFDLSLHDMLVTWIMQPDVWKLL